MLLATLLAFGTAHAQSTTTTVADAPGHFGAGLVVGDPTGLSLGWRPTEWNAVEVGAGWDLLDGQFKTSADYLQSLVVIDPNAAVRIPIYVGIGAGLGSDLGMDVGGGLRGRDDNDDAMGAAGANRSTAVSARVPIGASVLMMNAPVEIFAHVIPSLRVYPGRELGVDGALGVRYYF